MVHLKLFSDFKFQNFNLIVYSLIIEFIIIVIVPAIISAIHLINLTVRYLVWANLSYQEISLIFIRLNLIK